MNRPEPRRDSYGRYLLPSPIGEELSYQRVTTFASMAADSYNLSLWSQRMVAIGMAKRQDLSALAVSLRDPQGADKATLNNLVDQAKEAAGSSQGANTGTALHSLTEALDTGSPLEAGPWQADLDAYSKAMKAAGVRILPEYVERVVALDDYGVAGTLDRIVEYEGELYVGDLKSGKDPAAFPHEICIQLACYANADTMFDFDFKRVEMPKVNKEKALVMHLRPGSGRCDLYWFNIEAGWEASKVCASVRDWRKARKTDLAQPFGVGAKEESSDRKPDLAQPSDKQESSNRGKVCVACGTVVTEAFANVGLFQFGEVLCPPDYGVRQSTGAEKQAQSSRKQ